MEQNLTRREARENAFLAAFSATFHPDDPQPVLLNQPESHEHPLDEFSCAFCAIWKPIRKKLMM